MDFELSCQFCQNKFYIFRVSFSSFGNNFSLFLLFASFGIVMMRMDKSVVEVKACSLAL